MDAHFMYHTFDWHVTVVYFFTARRYASAVYAMLCLSVCALSCDIFNLGESGPSYSTVHHLYSLYNGLLNRTICADLEWPQMSFACCKTFQMQFDKYLCNNSHAFNWHSASRGFSVEESVRMTEDRCHRQSSHLRPFCAPGQHTAERRRKCTRQSRFCL